MSSAPVKDDAKTKAIHQEKIEDGIILEQMKKRFPNYVRQLYRLCEQNRLLTISKQYQSFVTPLSRRLHLLPFFMRLAFWNTLASESSFLAAIILMDRYSVFCPITFSTVNRLFFTCWVLAHKWLDDDCLNFKQTVGLGAFLFEPEATTPSLHDSLKSFNTTPSACQSMIDLQFRILDGLRYHLYISQEEMQAYSFSPSCSCSYSASCSSSSCSSSSSSSQSSTFLSLQSSSQQKELAPCPAIQDAFGPFICEKDRNVLFDYFRNFIR